MNPEIQAREAHVAKLRILAEEIDDEMFDTHNLPTFLRQSANEIESLGQLRIEEENEFQQRFVRALGDFLSNFVRRETGYEPALRFNYDEEDLGMPSRSLDASAIARPLKIGMHIAISRHRPHITPSTL